MSSTQDAASPQSNHPGLQLEVGRTYVTRDGTRHYKIVSDVRRVTKNDATKHPMFAVCLADTASSGFGVYQTATFCRDGSLYGCGESPLDLVREVVPRKVIYVPFDILEGERIYHLHLASEKRPAQDSFENRIAEFVCGED